jgi:hypothetical protein
MTPTPAAADPPAPAANGHEPTWDILLWMAAAVPGGATLLDDMRARDAKGLATYGVRLQPFNGRDNLRDALDEALDLAAYLCNEARETDGPDGMEAFRLMREAIRLAVAIRETIDAREASRS